MTRRLAFAMIVGLCVVAPKVEAQKRLGQVQPNRQLLEQRVMRRFAAIVKERLQLTDEQMGRLQQTNRKFEPRRRDLVARERAARVGLRAELAAGDSANQSRVKDLLEQVSRLQRERLDLLDSEQREMAEYMTPVQRAKFLGLQEQLQQRLEKERQDAAANARLPDK